MLGYTHSQHLVGIFPRDGVRKIKLDTCARFIYEESALYTIGWAPDPG
jgi:hypothetical protein